jgi:predicted O-methyltransferase YrrM
MNYGEFFKTFGGSARTKNMRVPSGRRMELPSESGLPKEFIRLDPWEMEYLFTVARRAKRGILEIGRLNGGSAFLLACAAPDVPIYSIDFAPQNDDRLCALFAEHGIGSNVRLIIGRSQDKHPQVGDIDLLFIDGDHSYSGCMGDIMTWYDRLLVHGHLLFHDAYCGRWGVQDAIADFMIDHPELQVILSPYIGAHHWLYPAGSMAHLIKRAPARAGSAP